MCVFPYQLTYVRRRQQPINMPYNVYTYKAKASRRIQLDNVLCTLVAIFTLYLAHMYYPVRPLPPSWNLPPVSMQTLRLAPVRKWIIKSWARWMTHHRTCLRSQPIQKMGNPTQIYWATLFLRYSKARPSRAGGLGSESPYILFFLLKNSRIIMFWLTSILSLRDGQVQKK